MKRQFLFLIGLLTSVFVYPQITFQRHYGGAGDDGVSSVLQTDDGGYLVAGHTNGLYTAFLVRTNQYGDTLWTKAIGSNLSQRFYSIKKTNDSCFIACGTTHGFGLYGYNYLLTKINSIGDTVWQKAYGGYGDEDAYDVIQTSDSGYALVGGTMSFGQGLVTDYFVKTNSIGDTLWTRVYEKFDQTRGYALLQLDDDGYIIVGSTYSSNEDIYLVRTDQFGDTLWTKTIGGPADDYGNSIQKTNDNGFIIFGGTSSYGAGESDIFLVKTDSNGIVQWSKTYGGVDIEEGFRGIICSDGGFAIAGSTGDRNTNSGNSYLIKTNSIGDTLWTRTFINNLNDWIGAIQETSEGGFILSGYITVGGNYDAYLIKTDENGLVAGINDNELSNNTINIFPNPSTDKINVQVPYQFGKTKTLEIFDYIGQLQISRTDNFYNLDISSYKSGLYYIVITNDKNVRQIKKIIKM